MKQHHRGRALWAKTVFTTSRGCTDALPIVPRKRSSARSGDADCPVQEAEDLVLAGTKLHA